MRNELDDLETQQNDLLVLNGGYMTTDILPQYRAYQDQIDQMNKKLAGVDTSVQNVQQYPTKLPIKLIWTI